MFIGSIGYEYPAALKVVGYQKIPKFSRSDDMTGKGRQDNLFIDNFIVRLSN